MPADFWKFFLPKNEIFFKLFNQSASNTVHMSELLYQVVCAETPHEEAMQFNQIGRLKLKGNELKDQVYAVSSKSLISPFERDDMYALASVINDVCDSIHISARRISLYKLLHLPPAVKDLAGIIIETSTELDNGVQGLSNLSNSENILKCCNKIKQLERYADKVYQQTISAVMVNETNSIELIKYTEILAALETATDKCEDATAVLESIIVKNN